MRRVVMSFLLVGLLAVLSVMPASAQDNPEGLVDTAIQYLGTQIGRALTRADLTDWNWQETFWPDASLNCPQPGVTYAQELTRGYIIILQTADARYELHTTPSGDRIVLCNTDLLTATATVAPAQSQGQPTTPPTPTAPDQPLLATPTPEAPSMLAIGGPDEIVNTPDVSLIYTGADGNVYLTEVSTPPGEPATTGVSAAIQDNSFRTTYSSAFGYYAWSPDGTQVAFVDNTDPTRLLITDFAGSAPTVVAEGVAMLYPPAWRADGAELAYLSPNDVPAEDNRRFMTIFAITADELGSGSATPRIVGSITQGVGCGGGTPDPAEAAYQYDTGYSGNRLAFTWLPDGTFLFSDKCTGIGLSRFNPQTGETAVVAAQLARVSLSPDNNHVVGISFSPDISPILERVSLADNQRQVIALDFVPDRVLWSRDGQRLYVSTAQPSAEFVVGGEEGSPAREYTVQLWEVSLSDGAAVLRFEQTGRGVGVMTEAQGGGLVFTFIGSARDLAQAVENNASDFAAQREAVPHSTLYYLNPDGRVFEMVRGWQPAFQPVALGIG